MTNTSPNNAKKERIEQMKKDHFNKPTVVNETAEDSLTINQKGNQTTTVNENKDKTTKVSESENPEHKMMTGPELADYEEKKKEKEKEKTGKVGRGTADRARPDDKDDKIIEYTDIIDFLFKELMIAPMDWSLNKVVNWTGFALGWGANEIIEAIVYKKKEEEKKKDNKKKEEETATNTPSNQEPTASNRTNTDEREDRNENSRYREFQKNIAQAHAAHVSQVMSTVPTQKNKKLLESVFEMVRNREFDKLKFLSPETREMMANMPAEELNKRFSKENTNNVPGNMLMCITAMEQISSNIATTRILTAKAEDANAFAGQDESQVFAQKRLEAMQEYKQLMAKVASEPTKYGSFLQYTNDFMVKTQEALKHISSEAAHGHYQENGSRPAENKTMSEIETQLASAKGTKFYNAELSLVDMAAQTTQNAEQIDSAREEINHREQVNEGRRENNDQRREVLNQTKENLQSPNIRHVKQSNLLRAQQARSAR